MAMSSFVLDHDWCSSIGTSTVNSLAISIPFLSLYQSQVHFGVVNSLILISHLSVT